MKPRVVAFIFFFGFSLNSNAQLVNDSTKVTVSLYIPAHCQKRIKSTDKLMIHLDPLEEESGKKSKIIGKRIENNVFSFELPKQDFLFIGFEIGDFNGSLLCIYNKKGTAFDDNRFSLFLKEGNYKEPQFFLSCFSN